MVYETRTRTPNESPWDTALVTFAFVLSLLVVLLLPAVALI